ncbi:MAG: hypothetical protein AAFY88_00890, partial [Acidobacteriota bacterium]
MWGRGIVAWLALLAGAVSAAAAPVEPRVEIDHGGVRVVGLGDAELRTASRLELPTLAWRGVLRITAAEAVGDDADPPADLPALLGAYDVDLELGALRFRPRFAPAPGLILEARFDGSAWARLVGAEQPRADASARFVVPEPATRERARVLSVTPSGEVPENLLRLYVRFSEPMSARHVLDHISLLDPSGTPIDDAFVEVPGGLWDRDR